MPPDRLLRRALLPACELLTRRGSGVDYGSPEALVMLLAIALQETKLQDRLQGGDGPARSFWQFEGGSNQALDLVMRNPITSAQVEFVCDLASIRCELKQVYWSVTGNDLLAAAMARLLLYLDAQPLPQLGDRDAAWAYYLRCWNPGKPHRETWDAHYATALATVQQHANDPSLTVAEELDRVLQARKASPQALIISPPSSGNQVVVDPVRFKPTMRRGSTVLVLLLAALQYAPDIIEAFTTGTVPGGIGPPWASALAFAAIALRDAIAANGAAKVATAAVDPVGRELAAGPATALMQVQHRTNAHLEELLRGRSA